MTGWDRGGSCHLGGRREQPEAPCICSWSAGGRVRMAGVPGGGLEKQTSLRSHQAAGKRMVLGSRLELCTKTSGFSRDLLSQCCHTERPPSELSDGLEEAPGGTLGSMIGTVIVLPLASRGRTRASHKCPLLTTVVSTYTQLSCVSITRSQPLCGSR